MFSKKINIAIDGFSSCGKSTLAKDLAKVLKYIYIDSGAMYRAITLYALESRLIKDHVIDVDTLEKKLDEISIWFSLNVASGKNETFLNNRNIEKEIRSLNVSNNVSRISELGFVREKLVKLQQEMGKNKGVVMDGRDIGTVVFPDAELKLFMTADPLVRARRRFDEMQGKGDLVSMDQVLENIKNRDYIDQNRKISPLTQAKDAIVLDNSSMSPQEQLKWILDLIETLVI